MIQSVYERDYRDPLEITQLRQLQENEEFKFNSKHKNSICASNFHKALSTIDLSPLVKRQKQSVVGSARSSRSSIKIISRCQKVDKKLWKLKSTMTGGFGVEASRKSGGVTTSEKMSRTKDSRTVSRYAPFIRLLTLLLINIHFLFRSGKVHPKCEGSNVSNDCYEDRMFKFPFIPQITPRSPIPKCRPATSVSEYRDEIDKVGSLIMKYRLHDHSKCGKNGIKCEHRIATLTNRMSMN